MSEKFKQEASAIVKQVRILALLLSAIFLVSLALFLWNAYENKKNEDVTNYHRNSSQILRGIRNSFLKIKYDFKARTATATAIPGDEHWLTSDQLIGVLYSVDSQVEDFEILNEKNRIGELDLPNNRLLKELAPLRSLIHNIDIDLQNPSYAMRVDAVLLALEQLDRLHVISLEESQNRFSLSVRWRNGILFTILLATITLVGLVISKTFRTLGKILRQQAQNAITLRREKDLLQTTLLSIGDAVITTDSEGKITEINPIAENLTGWTAADLRDGAVANVFKLVDQDTGQPIENPATTVLRIGETIPTGNLALLTSREGIEYQISYSAAPIRDNDKILGAVLVFNDVTEDEEMRDSLTRSKRDMQAIMNNTPNLVCLKDTDGHYLFVNSRYCEHFGVKNEDVIGKTDYDFFPEVTANKFFRNENEVISENRAMEFEDSVTIDNETRVYHTVKYPLHNEQGNIYAVSSITTDITESKNQDEIVRRSQKMDALGKLVGGVAHDYNNMLGVVIGYADLLSEMPENSTKQKKYINQIRHSAQRGAQLTKQLLQFSGRGVGEATALDVNQLLLDSKSLLEKTLTPQISIDFQLDEELFLTWLDSNALEDAILNLSINAMHAIDGTGGLTIRTANVQLNGKTQANATSLSDGDYAMICFSDTGCGMAPEVQEKIFDPFYTTKGELGTGLGLSQVYGFVQQSGGAITVESKPGAGTKIELYFPRYDERKINFDEPVTEVSADLSGNESILLVDDEIALLELSAETLERQGYQTFCASNAEDAIKILEAEKIDIMISDVVMPDTNGYQLATLVQKKFPTVKIQMASGYSENRHVEVASKELHETRMTKPYGATELLRQVRELLDS